MRNLLSNNFFSYLENDFQEEFDHQLNLDNAWKSYTISRLGLFFYFALLLLDWVRYEKGLLPGNWVFEALFFNHLLLIAFLSPFIIARKNMAAIRAGDFQKGKRLTWLTLGIMTACMLPLSILSILDRGTVTAFGIFILLCNLVITLPHEERIGLNLFCFVTILTAICFIHEGHSGILIVNVLEILGILLPTFIFSTVQFNLNISQFQNEKLLEKKNEEIEKEKARSDELLLNILPLSVAEELKQYGKVAPRYSPQSTVLFADFRDFSSICNTLSPSDLIDDLNHIFKNFDQIIVRNGLERIKTIGDAYMAFGGLSERGNETTVRMVRAALSMQEFLSHWNDVRRNKHLPVFEARIGIHAGPIVAGVVGEQRFAFDIWGQSVNVAARMEQTCEANHINISGKTYELVKDDYDCTFRGKIPVKNLEDQEMYYVGDKEIS